MQLIPPVSAAPICTFEEKLRPYMVLCRCTQCFIPAAFGIVSVFVYLIALLLLFGQLLKRLNGAIDRKKIGTVFRISLTACELSFF